MHDQAQSSLLSLPLELRVIIYHLLFNRAVTRPQISCPRNTKRHPEPVNTTKCHRILLTCQLCYREAVKLFYEHAVWDWGEVSPFTVRPVDLPEVLCEQVKKIDNMLVVKTGTCASGWAAANLRTSPETLIAKFTNLERLSLRFTQPLRMFRHRLEDYNDLSYDDFYQAVRSTSDALGQPHHSGEVLIDLIEARPEVNFSLYITWYLDYETSWGCMKTQMRVGLPYGYFKPRNTF